jgi:hypothetical protein
MYHVAKRLGYPAPLGLRAKHIRMVGFIGGIGLTVALFVADVAYSDPRLVGDAKLGALLSGCVGFFALIVGRVFDYAQHNVSDDATAQIQKDVLKQVLRAPEAAPGGVDAAEWVSRVVSDKSANIGPVNSLRRDWPEPPDDSDKKWRHVEML